MKKYLNFLVLFSIFILSFYLRWDAYIINNSFFTDEVLLFANIFNRNYIELLQPLQFFQSAPYIFLLLSKFVSLHIGINELCLRFIPFIFSLFSVFAFYKLSTLVFNNKFTQYIALFTFGINYQLLFYCQVFKQYSLDVLAIILFLWLVLKYFNDIHSIKQYTVFGLISLLFIFTSFPIIIFILAVYFTLLIAKKNILKLLYSALYPMLGLLIYYLFNLRFVSNSAYLHNYWAKGFQVLSIEFYKMNFDFLFSYYQFPILLLILIVIGFYFIYRNNKFLFCIFTLTIINTLVFAYLKIYPCERRLILFLLPILLIITLYPLDNIKKNVISFVTIFFSIIFLGYGYFNFFKNYISGNINYLRQNVKPLLEKIISKNDNGKVYVYYGAISTYFYYSLLQTLPKDVYLAQYPNDEKYSEILLQQDLENLPKGIYYLLFIKGTGTYDKDINYIEPYLKSNYEVLSNDTLKSAKLIKIIKK